MRNSPIIIITGPTASGKTSVSEELARTINAEIISIDTRTAYKELNIGTGKYSMSNNIKYHMVGIFEVGEKNTTYQYIRKTRKKIEEITSRNRGIIMTGGSLGVIFRLINGMEPTPQPDPDFRSHLENIYHDEGGDVLWERLFKNNKDMALMVHPNNKNRLIRYIEISELNDTGERIPPLDGNHLLFFTEINRKSLKRNIEKRVKEMMNLGWVGEVEGLIEKGITLDTPGMDSIGYPEVCGYLSGDLSEDELVPRIVSSTYNYARKQMTWKKRFDHIPLKMDQDQLIERMIDHIDQLHVE